MNLKRTLPRVEILSFAFVMERKLKENDHKGGWEDSDTDWLIKRIADERNELKRAYDKYLNSDELHPNIDALIQRIIDEAADVANFAMMVADKAANRNL
jgi:hypothetical protein